MNFDVTKNLSEAQMKVFNQFKEQMIEEHGISANTDEPKLLRFLKAREFDIPKARTMLRNNIMWRKNHDIDNIQDYEPPEVNKNLPLSALGFDTEKSPVLYIDVSGIDVPGTLRSARKSDIFRTVIRFMESQEATLNEISQKEGRLTEQWTMICDFEKFSFAQATNRETVETLLAVTQVYDANYPERLKNGYVINASVYFSMLFAVIKPFLSRGTLRKIQILGKDDWREKMSQLMDAESLPAFLGGQRTDPDGNPKCHLTVKHGGVIPAAYFLSDAYQDILRDPRFRMLNIVTRSFAKLEIDVAESGSKLEWEFETRNHDISFAIKYKENGKTEKASKELQRIQNVNASLFPVKGTHSCKLIGKYTLVFDNSFSVFRSKELYYRVNLVTPNGETICVTKH